MKIIIDASSNGSGGGRRHLKETIIEFTNPNYNIDKIYIWGPKSLLNILPKSAIIIKKSSILLNKGLIGIIIWQLIFRDRCFKKIDFDCIYSPFGNYIGKLKPYVTMSQNMLMFEKKERKKFGFSLARLKLKTLYYVQKKSFINSSGVIFLSNYAKKIISNKLNFKFKSSVVINHGVSTEFNKRPKIQLSISDHTKESPFKLLYVSNILPYKYHLNVIKTINELVQEDIPIKLTLVGKIDSGYLGKKVNYLVNKVNNSNNYKNCYYKAHYFKI